MEKIGYARLPFALLVLAWLLGVGASPAFAHAGLVSTEPSAGAQLSEPPAKIVLRFSEAVEISGVSVRVYNERSEVVSTGAAGHGGDQQAVETPLGTLAEGGYVVTWRVVSADAHPINGAFTFQVGEGGGVDTRALSQSLLADIDGDRSVDIAYTAVRGLEFLALLISIGVVGFLVFFRLDDDSIRRSRRLLIVAASTLAVSSLVAVLLQGLYGAGLSLSKLFDVDVIAGTLRTRFGIAGAVRVALALALVALVIASRRQDNRSRYGLAALAVAAAITVSASGHATSGRWVIAAFIADVAHLIAGGLWIGGLVVLVAVVVRRTNIARPVIAWFSGLAFWCVVVMVVTGTFQGWRQVRNLDELFGSRYGVLLLVKIALFAVLLLAASYSRRWAERGGADSETRFVKRSMSVEIGLAVAVLATTSLLVNAPPVEIAVENKPFAGELRVGETIVDLAVDPARTGPNRVFVYVLDQQGKSLDVPEVSVRVTEPGRNIGPIVAPVEKIRPGQYALGEFVFPVSGDWRLDVSVRTSEVDQSSASITVKVR